MNLGSVNDRNEMELKAQDNEVANRHALRKLKVQTTLGKSASATTK